MELPFVGDAVNSFVSGFLSTVATLFVFALRRNYPIVGHFRYFFEQLGEFFRQYFFSMDREELPFNRASYAVSTAA